MRVKSSLQKTLPSAFEKWYVAISSLDPESHAQPMRSISGGAWPKNYFHPPLKKTHMEINSLRSRITRSANSLALGWHVVCVDSDYQKCSPVRCGGSDVSNDSTVSPHACLSAWSTSSTVAGVAFELAFGNPL